MILDKTTTLALDQAITATAISENVIQFPATGTVIGDAAAIKRQLGGGEGLPLLIQVTEDFATLTSLTITLETADNAALSTNPVVLATTGAIPVATLKAGYRPTQFRFFPEGEVKEYLGMRFTVTGSAATAGKVTAGVAVTTNSGWLTTP